MGVRALYSCRNKHTYTHKHMHMGLLLLLLAQFLCMSLLTFGTPPREASAAVVKTGGDMPRMEPAEEGDLARFPDLRLRMRVLPSSSSACDKLVGKTGGGSVPSPSLAPAAEPKAAGPTRKIEGTAERRDVGGAGGLPGAPSMLAVEEGPLDTDLMLEVSGWICECPWRRVLSRDPGLLPVWQMGCLQPLVRQVNVQQCPFM